MVTGTSLSDVFPLGSRVNELGRLEVGGCDTLELAREFGTPAYVVAEDDLRARARAFLAADAQPVLVRVTPDVAGDTHEKISTGQADSKFGFALAQAHEALARVREVDGLSLRGVHAHIGSQLLTLEPFARAAAELAKLGEYPV